MKNSPLNNKSGASMLFVLAVMLLLMAIGASALNAANANAGAGLAQQAQNQVNLYADSIQKSVKHALEYDDSGKHIGDVMNGLGAQLLQSAYLTETNLSVDLTPTITGVDLSAVTSVRVNFTPIVTVYSRYKQEVPEETEDIYDIDGIYLYTEITVPHEPREPEIVGVSGTVEVTVTVNCMGKSCISVAAYQLTGALLQDDNSYIGAAPIPSNYVALVDCGEWRFVSHDKA